MSPDMERFQAILRRLIPCITFVIVIFQPAVVQLYFLASSICNAGLLTVLRNRAFRSYLGLAQFPREMHKSNSASAAGYAGQVRAAGSLAGAPATPAVNAKTPNPINSATSSDVSFIDRGVDRVKSMWGAGNTETQAKKQKLTRAEKEAKAEQLRADQYEERRQKEIRSEVYQRNEAIKAAFQAQKEQERISAGKKAFYEARMKDEAPREETDGKRVKRGKGKSK